MGKLKMTPVAVRERLLVVDPPQDLVPKTDQEGLDILWLAASGAAAPSYDVHRRVQEERQAFSAYRASVLTARKAEADAHVAFIAAYNAHDVEGMRAAALARRAAESDAEAFGWVPSTLTFADGTSQDSMAKLTKAIESRRLIATLWAALLVTWDAEYVEDLPQAQRRYIERGAIDHLPARDEVEWAEGVLENRNRTDHATQAKAEKILEVYGEVLEQSKAWNLA